MQTRAPYAPRASLLAFALLAASTVAAGAQTLEWRFDNVTDFNSNIVRNRSGSTAYNGTLLGGHTQTRGALGNAADFNGSNGYLRASGTTGLRFPSGMTIEAFVRRDSNHSEDGVVSKWYGGDQFLLTFYPTGHGRLQFGIRDGANHYGSLYYDFPDSVYLGEWIHVAATYNGSGRLRLYVDGTLVASANRTVSGMAYGGRPIQAGDSGNSWSRFDGAIDEVKVWNYERSPSQLDHPLRPRVLVVEYDSTNPTYNNPHVISDGMIDDIRSSSQFVEFEIAQWVNTGSLPPQRSGGGFDYAGLYSTYNVCARAGRGAIHEVWVWAGPDGGMLEWAVNGPRREAYGLGVGMPACTVQTVTMGFNY
ncbi:MAG: LamG domain-containing protein, partial [Acidobacteriota bacterium]